MADLDRERWQRLLAADPDANPFLDYDFLDALHASRCADADSGWTPRILGLWRAQQLVGAVPLYLKTHSYGEYVFDWAWADAHHRRGLAYYPKWLAAVPFTPVPGSRLLAIDDDARSALAAALRDGAAASGLSSMHVLFAPSAQIQMLSSLGFVVRRGVQFHWLNAGYADFEQFLAALTQPKRKKIRAERRKVAEAGISVQRLTGAQITDADWRLFERCYRGTYAEHGATPYLNLRFFQQLARSLPQHLLLIKASRGARAVACALGVFDERPATSALYGRYWGALEPVSCLHFECCYYQMIDFAIERRLRRFEGGAQGAHKLARGLDPVQTWSAHWIADPTLRTAIVHALQREDRQMEAVLDELYEHRALREGAPLDPTAAALTPGPSR